MVNNVGITSIRILPSDKKTFMTEDDFRKFVTDTMVARGGLYYFPNTSMKCSPNSLVLFQYDGMIRAIGILVGTEKKPVTDERGVDYAGYYRFDINTLEYLKTPIDRETMKVAYPTFSGFNQSKQNIDIQYLNNIMELLKSRIDGYDMIEELDVEMEQFKLLGSDREAVVKVRVNQSIFRKKLIRRYGKCCLCGMSEQKLLIASHIKPWSESASEEKLNIDNGLLLCPNHDRLFDEGLITFDEDGYIVISEMLSMMDRRLLNIKSDMRISLTDKNKEYLQYHRNFLFKSEVGTH